MNQAWKAGKGSLHASKSQFPVGSPKPSPQQTPGKPKATPDSKPETTKVTPSPWDEAQKRGQVAAHTNKPLLGKKSTLVTEMAGLFSLDEIQRLGTRFRKLDKDSSGSLSIDEFLNLPELQKNPLVQRVVEIFDVDRNGEVDFKEFIQGISHFTVTGNKEKRLRFAFRIYDVNNDGFISNGELFQVMKSMVGTSMVDTQLQHIVDTTILLGDKDLDGRISYAEFSDLVNNGSDIHKKMIIEGI